MGTLPIESTTVQVSVEPSAVPPEAPLADGEVARRHTWDQFREAGMLWAINGVLHLFGWVIIVANDDDTGEVVDVWPARTSWRGFPPDREAVGYQRTSEWMRKAANAIASEAKE